MRGALPELFGGRGKRTPQSESRGGGGNGKGEERKGNWTVSGSGKEKLRWGRKGKKVPGGKKRKV